MTIQTHFNVGDTLFTLNPTTQKAISFKVAKVAVVAGKDDIFITYQPETKDYSYTSYVEGKCFASIEELKKYVFGE